MHPAVPHHPAVGDLQPDLHLRHEAWLQEQYLRDLDTLERVEQQVLGAEPCFFSAMGELHAGRKGSTR